MNPATCHLTSATCHLPHATCNLQPETMTNDIFSQLSSPNEAEMQRVIGHAEGVYAGHYGMLCYHMGWVDAALHPVVVSSGKRILVAACLLACEAVGGACRRMPCRPRLPSSPLHNFSLIHDDVEDDSPTCHRPTVWALWGVPQAINAGDAMLTLAWLALHGLAGMAYLSCQVAMDACTIFDYACLHLTEGNNLTRPSRARM